MLTVLLNAGLLDAPSDTPSTEHSTWSKLASSTFTAMETALVTGAPGRGLTRKRLGAELSEMACTSTGAASLPAASIAVAVTWNGPSASVVVSKGSWQVAL